MFRGAFFYHAGVAHKRILHNISGIFRATQSVVRQAVEITRALAEQGIEGLGHAAGFQKEQPAYYDTLL